jgi:hypothetical protein
MTFPQKSATQLEYLRAMAEIAYTLSECKSQDCTDAVDLIGQEVQAILQPSAEEDDKLGSIYHVSAAANCAQSSPALATGDVGTAVSAVDAAIEDAKRAKVALNAFTADSSVGSQAYSDAARAYNQAMGRLEDEIEKSVRGNPDIGTAVDPVAAAVEDLKRARNARDEIICETRAEVMVAQRAVRKAVMRLEDATHAATCK